MIMERLKVETRPYHDRIEGDPLSRGLTGMDLNPDRYRHVLTVYYGLHAPLEMRLQKAVDWAALGFDIAPRMKTPLLVRDLSLLGLDIAEVATLPQCEQLPPIGDLATALGCMYVLEGSTLGGQIIARHVAKVLGFDAAHGTAFFNSYGTQVGPMWKSFKQFVEEHAAGHEEAIIATAAATFNVLGDWFNRGAHQYDLVGVERS